MKKRQRKKGVRRRGGIGWRVRPEAEAAFLDRVAEAGRLASANGTRAIRLNVTITDSRAERPSHARQK